MRNTLGVSPFTTEYTPFNDLFIANILEDFDHLVSAYPTDFAVLCFSGKSVGTVDEEMLLKLKGCSS